MNRKILGLLVVGLTIGSVASAQETVLNYQGYVMGGTITSLPNGFTANTDGSFPPLPTSSYTGSITASITLSGSLNESTLELISYSLNFGPNGQGFNASNTNLFEGNFIDSGPQGSPSFCGPFNCIDLTTSTSGAITGAAVDFTSGTYHTSQTQFEIGPNGDSFSYLYATSNGTCLNQVPLSPPGPQIPYTGGTVSACSVNVSNPTAGVWSVTKAPEIDPGSAGSGLALLLGSLVVLLSRRTIPVRSL